MPSVFPGAAAKGLLILHALAASVLVGASTHQAVVAVQLLRGRLHLQRLARLYAKIIGIAFPVAFALGLLIYPAFRYQVRALYLDRYEPWASNLFDFKESLAALAVPLAVGLAIVGWKLDVREERALVPLYALFALGVWALSTFALVSGLVITSVRGV